MIVATYLRLAAAVLAAGLALSAAPVAEADKLTEQNMTQKDYDGITDTGPGQAGDKTVLPVHNLSDAEAKGVKDAHGVKVFKGKDWRKMSPAERGKALHDLSGNLGANTVLVIEVPSGNVWAIDSVQYLQLSQHKTIRPWQQAEKEALPKAVKADPLDRQEDRRNGGRLELHLDTRP